MVDRREVGMSSKTNFILSLLRGNHGGDSCYQFVSSFEGVMPSALNHVSSRFLSFHSAFFLLMAAIKKKISGCGDLNHLTNFYKSF